MRATTYLLHREEGVARATTYLLHREGCLVKHPTSAEYYTLSASHIHMLSTAILFFEVFAQWLDEHTQPWCSVPELRMYLILRNDVALSVLVH